MALLDFSQIPGYADAANEEQTNRELAFFANPPPICGIPIRHLNSRHHLMLVGCENRFFVGGIIRPEDVAMVLWFLSPEYVENDAKARAKFIGKKVAPAKFNALRQSIAKYLAGVYQDGMGKSGAGSQKEYTAPLAFIIDVCGVEYGWSDEAVLEMPIARIFQYLRRIVMRKNPRAIMFNSTDKLLSEYLRATNEPAAQKSA